MAPGFQYVIAIAQLLLRAALTRQTNRKVVTDFKYSPMFYHNVIARTYSVDVSMCDSEPSLTAA